MAGFLFDNMVFGPVFSRRLGVSLGINLLPIDNKYCNFNCIYCECGWTNNKKGKMILAKRDELKQQLEAKLKEVQGTVNEPDAITFAGNGEPTIHPQFAEIIDDTIELRDKYAPKAAVSILSNATMLSKPKVAEALKKVDKNIQKLDSGIESTYKAINQALSNKSLDSIVEGLLGFEGKLIIQTLFLRGEYEGKIVDNTTNEEVEAWLEIVKKVKPEYVMLYPIERGTPAENIEKISKQELQKIAEKVEAAGIRAEVY
ncbi:MAG: radical SAM protein [Marinilabiliales bacterium]|nr:MAG: radical SAM protein [Marinilabiliales bacterium]